MAIIHFGQKSHRLISSHFPPVGIFDEFGTPEEAHAAMRLEMMTSDRHTGALGRLDAIAKDDQTAGGPGSSMAMAAFLYPSPGGGRFNREALGAWYAGLKIETAIKETLHHSTRRLRASEAGFPNEFHMRELVSSPKASLHDLTADQDNHPDLYHDNDYRASQDFGEELRSNGLDGIIYNSVRDKGGKNIVIFRPRLLVPVTQGDHYSYKWDTDGNPTVSKITNVKI